MKSADDIERYFQKSTLSTNSCRHEAVFEKIQRAQDQSKDTAPALSGPKIRNTIMKSPTTKLATAAVVIAAITLGLLEFIGGGTGIPAAGDVFKTSDLKDDPMGIGKGVLVSALN